MLEDIFKDRVRALVTPKFEDLAEKAKENFSRKSAEMAARGLLHSSIALQAQHEARTKEKQEQIEAAWEAIKQVAGALHTQYSQSLAADIKSEVEDYASSTLSGVPEISFALGNENFKRQFDQEFDAKRTRALNKVRAEIDLFVDDLRTSASLVQAKELEQKFQILLSPKQALRDFEVWTERLKIKSRTLALLFVDIDHFKALNGKYTHATIDRCLFPEFMSLMKDFVEFRGEAYRYGGEEFIILLPNYDLVEGRAFGEKLRSKVEKHCFKIDSVDQNITVSIGIAIWPQHGANYAELLQAANTAESAAKAKRNMVVVAE